MDERDKDAQKKIDPFLLKRPDGKLALPARQSTHWSFQGLYLSPICLVAHLSPRPRWDERPAQQDLYALLRFINHLAAENNIIRPMVGAIEDLPGSDHVAWSRVRGWSAAAEWHRGCFALRVQKSAGFYSMLADLLQPRPKLIEQRVVKEGKDAPWYLKEIGRDLTAPKDADLFESLQRFVNEPLPKKKEESVLEVYLARALAGGPS